MIGKNISQLIDMMEKGQATSEEIVKIYIENISEKGLDKDIFKSLCKDEVIERAKDIDRRRKDGQKLGALAGIPLALTEDISTKGLLTEAGSNILKGYIPPFNATIVERLLEEDAIIIGKIKMPEFSLGDSDYGARCIFNGGALAVIGSSRGGEGLLRLSTSYGLVSRYGIISATSSLSPLTLLAKEAGDLALILNVIGGHDKKDSASVPLDKTDYTKIWEGGSKLKVKILKGLSNDRLIEDIEAAGVGIEECILERTDHILPALKVLYSAEFSSNMARYDGIRYGYRAENYENREDLYKNTRSEGFGLEAKKTIIFGNYVISGDQYEDYYKKSQKVRTLIRDEIDKLLKDGSILLIPLAGNLDENLKMAYKELAAMTGCPMILLPYEDSKAGYMDLCLLANAFDERTLLDLVSKLGPKFNSQGGDR